jgi:aminocarboxymuconate-semialdehyde decarboxylase
LFSGSLVLFVEFLRKVWVIIAGIILPSEQGKSSTSSGRPIGDEYYSIARKLEFMDLHGIDKSIISSANPWLDFLSGREQVDAACLLNDELTVMCDESGGRIAGFGLLPLSDIDASVEEIKRIAAVGKLKGVIIGTKAGDRTRISCHVNYPVDHPDLVPLCQALSLSGLVAFVHTHYGVGDSESLFGDQSGHVLPLALGFPFETTTAISRLILSGIRVGSNLSRRL